MKTFYFIVCLCCLLWVLCIVDSQKIGIDGIQNPQYSDTSTNLIITPTNRVDSTHYINPEDYRADSESEALEDAREELQLNRN